MTMNLFKAFDRRCFLLLLPHRQRRYFHKGGTMNLFKAFDRRCFLLLLLITPYGCLSQTSFRGDHKGKLISEGESIFPRFSTEETSILGVLGTLVGLTTPEIMAILNLGRMGLGVVETLHTIFTKVFNGTSIDFSVNQRPGLEKQLLSMFEIVTLRLEQIQRGVLGTEGSLRALAKGLPHLVRWEIALNTIESYVLPINNLYHRFSYYQKHKLEVENYTLVDFADSVISHNTDSIQSYMANIHSMVSPNDPPQIRGTRLYQKDEYEVHNRVNSQMSSNMRLLLSTRYNGRPPPARLAKAKMEEISLRPSIFKMLEEAIDNYESCSRDQSPQQLLLGLYTLLALTQARGYAMVNFSLNLLRYHNRGNFTIERKLSDELYTHYSQALLDVGKVSINRAKNDFRKCDPKTHEEGKSFVMLTELLQGYIENEVDLNSHNTCGSQCSNYQHSNVGGCYLPGTQYCGKHRRCNGTVHDCRFYDADAFVCISSVPYRRYDWIKYENLQLLGVEDSCPNLMKVDSWWRFFYHCSYCMCLCDDPTSPTSDRFISLRPSVSDIAENKVVTGIRFVKKNKVIHIEVQEGLALPQGQVDPSTLAWVDVEPISVTSNKYREEEDYITLTYETRNIDLDYLKAPKDHVVTGLKFRMLGQHVNLEMWVTPINFTTGIMTPNMSFWISNDNTPVMSKNPRKLLNLVEPDDPRKSVADSEVDSTADMYVILQPTSMQGDVAQLTVPFFDAQHLSPEPPSWFEGVQLYHRGSKGFGGFIAFQVFNYNFTHYFEVPIDDGGIVVL